MGKVDWHRRTTALLVLVAKDLAIPTAERTIRSNKAGPAVGGEVTMSAPKRGLYVTLGCPIDGYGDSIPLSFSYARTCTIADPYGVGRQHLNRRIRQHQLTRQGLGDALREIAP